MTALLMRWLVVAGIAAAIGAFGWIKGNDHGTQKLTDYIGKEAVEVVRVAKAREIITKKIVTKYREKEAETKIKVEYIDREVVKYAEANTGICLDPEWRRLHDEATGSVSVSGTAGRVDGPAGAPKAAEALSTVTENYAIDKRNADRLEWLQEWVRQHTKVK